MMARPDVDAALWRLLVDLERPAALDEWQNVRRREAPSVRGGAISVKDKHGNDILRRAA